MRIARLWMLSNNHKYNENTLVLWKWEPGRIKNIFVVFAYWRPREKQITIASNIFRILDGATI